MTDLDVLEGLAKAVVDTRKAYHLGEDGPNGLDLSFAYDDAVTAFQKASLPHEETILSLISAARERDAMREALTEIRDGFFSQDVCVLIARQTLNQELEK